MEEAAPDARADRYGFFSALPGRARVAVGRATDVGSDYFPRLQDPEPNTSLVESLGLRIQIRRLRGWVEMRRVLNSKCGTWRSRATRWIAFCAGALAMVGQAHGGGVSFEDRTGAIFDNRDTGDQSISFEAYKIEPLGHDSSECATTTGDVAEIKGPYKYSCRATVLARDTNDVIHKFSAIACRFGNSPAQSRMFSDAATDFMIGNEEKNTRAALGVYDPLYFKTVRSRTHCVPAGKEDISADQQAAVDRQSSSAPGGTTPHPTTVRITMVNHDRYRLGLRFFSFTRDGYAWPAPRSHWDLNGRQTFELTCQSNESIRYGAWRQNQNVQWGVGRYNFDFCNGECSVDCGGNKTFTLGDGGPDAGPPPATFMLTSQDRGILEVRFYSPTHPGQVWTGNLLAGREHYGLACERNDKVCFGAWRNGSSATWGMGHGDQGCTACCVTCGDVLETTLLDGGDYTPDPAPNNRDNSSGISAGDATAAAGFLGNLVSALPRRGGGGGVVIRNNGGSAYHYGPGPRPPESGISGGR